jgi:hypothetical protein
MLCYLTNSWYCLSYTSFFRLDQAAIRAIPCCSCPSLSRLSNSRLQAPTMANQYDAGLLALPKELLVKIRSHLHCLRDHVNFSLACSHVFRMYTRKYWKFACISSGWGMSNLSPNNLAKLQNRSARYAQHRIWPWRGLARIIVKDAPLFDLMSAEDLAHLDKVPGTPWILSASPLVVSAYLNPATRSDP